MTRHPCMHGRACDVCRVIVAMARSTVVIGGVCVHCDARTDDAGALVHRDACVVAIARSLASLYSIK